MYEVVLMRAAKKELMKIKKGNFKVAERITAFIKALKEIQNPFSLPNARKMQGEENRYRWRVGDYRVIGAVKNELLVIQVIRIAHRQEAYD